MLIDGVLHGCILDGKSIHYSRHPKEMQADFGTEQDYSAAEATLDMLTVPGGKRLMYTHVHMPMTTSSPMRRRWRSASRRSSSRNASFG